jgi:hypothetical protein
MKATTTGGFFMMMRTTFAAFISLATLFMTTPSHAQARGSEDLQRRVYQLESTVYQLSQRLERLEYGAPDQGSRWWICTVKDSTWGTVYQNKAESRLQAAANATNNCITASMAANCKAQPVCERL